jgi:hypothetical protein
MRAFALIYDGKIICSTIVIDKPVVSFQLVWKL